MSEQESAAAEPQQQSKVRERTVRHRQRITKLERMSCWPEVFAMLENGDPIDEIAQFIQGTKQEYNEIGHNSLRRVLYYWVQRHPEMSANRLPTVALQLVSTAPHIDPLDGLNMIMAIQMDRISSLYNMEKRNEINNPRTEKEIRLMTEIFRTMAEVESKKKRYAPPTAPTTAAGSVASQLDQLREIYTKKYGQAVARVVLHDESRRRVLNALEHIRKGDSHALHRILERNRDKSVQLEEQEVRRAREDSNETDRVIDVDPLPDS